MLVEHSQLNQNKLLSNLCRSEIDLDGIKLKRLPAIEEIEIFDQLSFLQQSKDLKSELYELYKSNKGVFDSIFNRLLVKKKTFKRLFWKRIYKDTEILISVMVWLNESRAIPTDKDLIQLFPQSSGGNGKEYPIQKLFLYDVLQKSINIYGTESVYKYNFNTLLLFLRLHDANKYGEQLRLIESITMGYGQAKGIDISKVINNLQDKNMGIFGYTENKVVDKQIKEVQKIIKEELKNEDFQKLSKLEQMKKVRKIYEEKTK